MKLENIEPFTLGDKVIEEVSVKALTFVDYAAAVQFATDNKTYQRARIKAAVTLDGQAPAEEEISQLPVSVGKAILAAMEKLDGAEHAAGKVLTPEANGVDQPILFELGTPIKIKTREGTHEIKELEFLARTFGDLEDVLAEAAPIQQAVAALKRVAAPVGTRSPILSEAMIKQITIVDGLAIATQVVRPLVE